MSEQDIQKYEKMMEEDPGSMAFAPLAEAYRKTGNLDDAIRVAESGLELHPGYTGGLVVLGRALYEKKELDKAAQVLKKAVEETPESYLGQKFLGKALMEMGENKAALSALEAANVQSPDDAEILELLEKVRPKAQPPEAMAFSDKVEERGPQGNGIVTYEQKPTTVDGVELEPLPSKADEGSFSFSENQTGEPVPVVPVEDAGTPVETEIESLDELGPEAAAFMEEADKIDDAVFSTSEEEIKSEGEPPAIEDLFEEAEAEPPEIELLPMEMDPFEQVQPAEDVAPPRPNQPENRRQPGEDTLDAVPDTTGTASPVTVPAGVAPSMQEDQVFEAPRERNSDEAIPDKEPDMAGMEPEPPEQRGEEVVADFTPASQAPPEPAAQPSPDGSASSGDISTETLADLYANQGLVEKAAEIYRQILLERPSDEGIATKLRNLELETASPHTGNAPDAPETPAGNTSPSNADDIVKILDTWLQNAERMRRK